MYIYPWNLLEIQSGRDIQEKIGLVHKIFIIVAVQKTDRCVFPMDVLSNHKK
jgi:hypothetical protein